MARMPDGNAIDIRGLRKSFGDTKAVDDVSFAVGHGDVFGFMGHNGAGKTTTICMLLGLIRPSGGSASVLGHDIVRDSLAIRRVSVSPTIPVPTPGRLPRVAAYAVALVCLVNLAVLHARETYTALLSAFVPMAAALLPGMFYMYRPDLFVPLIRTLVVFPLNLVWYPDFSRQWGLLLAALLLALAAGLIAAAGRRIERKDVG
jgi:energy-coupling factor transporter ATP-binding protein EcfA2